MLEKNVEALEQELLEIKTANQKKSDFLSRMSHEIRTPLNAIIGLSYLSMENENLPVNVRENLGKIEQSAQFLLSFANDIFSLSELEAGKIALEQDTIHTGSYLEKLVYKAEQMAEAKQIHFTTEIDETLGQYYVFDSKKLSKAILHLIECAVKSTPVGGTIAFGVKVLTTIEETAEDIVKVCFEIQDNGLGIEETMLSKVFDPFEQIYGESRTLYNGSGLELAIAKNTIDLMEGTVKVDSKKGEGTCFTVIVDWRKERRNAEHPKEDSKVKYDFSGRRALVVEDNAINIEIEKNILLHKEFEVEVALNGQEAVDAFRHHEAGYYDIILMDIRMPVMDGLEAATLIRNMKERPDGADIPIIAMTANAFEEDVKKSFMTGMNGHLSKPIDIKKMYTLLDELINVSLQE